MKPLIHCTLLAVVLSAGCIKREERIRVFEDGRVTLTTLFEGDESDVLNGDPGPSQDAGWTMIDEKRVTDDEGRVELSRTAELALAAGQPLPESYAEPGSELADLALRFPTTVKIEERADGTYYHFRRVYEARPHARFHYEEQQVLESDEIKDIKHKEPEELTPEDRSTLAQAFLDAHVRKVANLIDAVVEEHVDDIPQDTLLLVRQRALAVFESSELITRIVKMIEDDDESEDFDGLEERLGAQLKNEIVQVLKEHNLTSSAIDAFMAAGERVDRRHELTGDLADEEWFVTLELPGEIVAHNSFDPTLGGDLENKTGVDKPHEKNMPLMITDSEGNAVYIDNPGFKVGWHFKGTALFDKDVVLMATSVVKK